MSPDLKTGATREIFIFSGNVPILKDKSKMQLNQKGVKILLYNVVICLINSQYEIW